MVHAQLLRQCVPLSPAHRTGAATACMVSVCTPASARRPPGSIAERCAGGTSTSAAPRLFAPLYCTIPPPPSLQSPSTRATTCCCRRSRPSAPAWRTARTGRACAPQVRGWRRTTGRSLQCRRLLGCVCKLVAATPRQTPTLARVCLPTFCPHFLPVPVPRAQLASRRGCGGATRSKRCSSRCWHES